AGPIARDGQLDDRAPRAALRPRQPRALHAQAQERRAHGSVRRRTVYERLRDADTARQHGPHLAVELRFEDERYLPFETAGAISSWRLTLNNVFRQFDYSTITDVVLHVRYTARDGGAPLREAARGASTEATLSKLQLAEGRT